MKKKRKTWAVFLLWSVFVILAAGIAYLSFQNGEAARGLGEDLILKITEYRYPGQTVSQEELLKTTYVCRQLGRVAAFLLLGLLGTVTIHISCRHSNWLFRTLIAAGLLFAVAYLTEALKKYIPTRHYSYEELLLSMASAAAGFLIVSVVSLLCEAVRWMRRLVHAH